ncbi:hypothetical protein PG999_000144 [Apiospora kogelbergensis]|uniref:Uncharacterized protein n=1 Tax=Apiospora kogelbergensis TaxID=1337665 RepID=A0AAW0RB21_9PEZI
MPGSNPDGFARDLGRNIAIIDAFKEQRIQGHTLVFGDNFVINSINPKSGVNSPHPSRSVEISEVKRDFGCYRANGVLSKMDDSQVDDELNDAKGEATRLRMENARLRAEAYYQERHIVDDDGVPPMQLPSFPSWT